MAALLHRAAGGSNTAKVAPEPLLLPPPPPSLTAQGSVRSRSAAALCESAEPGSPDAPLQPPPHADFTGGHAPVDPPHTVNNNNHDDDGPIVQLPPLHGPLVAQHSLRSVREAGDSPHAAHGVGANHSFQADLSQYSIRSREGADRPLLATQHSSTPSRDGGADGPQHSAHSGGGGGGGPAGVAAVYGSDSTEDKDSALEHEQLSVVPAGDWAGAHWLLAGRQASV